MNFREPSIDPPDGLHGDGFVLRPIRAADAELDYEAVMESREYLRKWEQSTWPTDDFTVDANREDLAKLEQRHADGEAFAYTVMNVDQDECLGCVYIVPPDARWFANGDVTALSADQWSDCDALIFFWVRKATLTRGLDRVLLDSLRGWFERDWSVESPVFVTNEQFDQQVTMIERAGLARRFEIKLPQHPGRYFAYACTPMPSAANA